MSQLDGRQNSALTYAYCLSLDIKPTSGHLDTYIYLLNVDPDHRAGITYKIDVSTSKAAVDLTALSPLEILGSTDRAVEEYTEWLVLTVQRDTLKAVFQ